MSYTEGDWVVEKDTGRVGIIRKRTWCEVSIRFGKAVALRYPDEVELAPLDLTQEDYFELQQLAVDMDDKHWFQEISQQLNGMVKL